MQKVDNEQLWLDRIRASILKSKKDYYVSWWLRCDYPGEATTAQINYWLKKSVAKGVLKMQVNKQFTKYFLQ